MSSRSYTWEDKDIGHSYDDIIHPSRPKSKKHPPTPIAPREAQPSAFDALSCYSDKIAETHG